jgi:ATP-dependent helicase/nuclease subunit A
VQDLIHLLRVVNDPTDELALVGVLRSPLFAIDDAAIIRLRLNNQQSLWHALMNPPEPPEQATAEPDERARALAFACDTLRHLHALRGRLTVVQLLREALAATGYLATISGLTDGAQRRANVEKLIEAARLSGTSGVFAFSEYLEKLLRAEPREGEAPLEAEGSVRLMTVHKSKGLEFPIVVLPDLGRNPPNPGHSWLARRSYGLALRMRDDVGDTLKPTAYQLALHEEQRMERAERERLLYVALTRARDYLILSGTTVRAGADAWLSRLLAALDYPPESGGIPAGAYGPLQMWQY